MKRRITSLIVILVFVLTMILGQSMAWAEDNPSDNTVVEQQAEDTSSDEGTQTDQNTSDPSIITDPDLQPDFEIPEDHLTDLDKPITKLELCDLLIHLYDFEKSQLGGAPEPAVPTVSPFKDTDDPAVLKAFSLGIVTVPKNRMFYPDRPATKAVKMKMFYDFLKIFDSNIEDDVPHDPGFEDSDEIAPWAEQAINYLHEKGIADPDENGEFNPNDTITKEDSNEMTMQLADSADNHKPYYLYGFNIINNRYINHGGFTEKSILDVNKVNNAVAAKKVAITIYDDNSQDGKISISEKASDAFKSLDVKVDGKYDGVAWSGEVSAEYGTSEEVKQHSKMISNMEFHAVQDVGIQFNTTPIKDLMSDKFLQDVAPLAGNPPGNSLSEADYKIAKDVINHYGSHLITHYVLGGRLDLNANFNDTSDVKLTNAEIEANVKYMYAEASTDVTIKNNVSTMKSNSTVDYVGEGGSSLGGRNLDDLISKYPDWRKSLDSGNEKKYGYADICRLFSDSLDYPIWKLLDPNDNQNGDNNQTINTKLQMAFDKIAEEQGILLEGYVPARDGDIITNVTVISADNADDIKCPFGYKVVKEYGWTPNNDDERNNPMAGAVDFNAKAGGKYIYMFYKMGTLKDIIENPEENRNITDLHITEGKDTTMDGYYKIPVDLNQKAGGKYLNLNLGRLIYDDRHFTSLRAIVSDSNQIDWPMGWERPTNDMDLNNGARGKYIHLVMRREVVPGNDPKNPVISLTGDQVYRMCRGQTYTDLGATAWDAKDGDITKKITVEGVPANPLKYGTYTITYKVKDSDGNYALATKTVIVSFFQW